MMTPALFLMPERVTSPSMRRAAHVFTLSMVLGGCGGAGSGTPKVEVTEVYLAADPLPEADADAILPAGGQGIADLFGVRSEPVRVCESLFGPAGGETKVRLEVHLSVSHGDLAGISKIEAVGDEAGRYRHWTACLMGVMRGAAFRDPTAKDVVYLLDVERAGVEPPKAMVGRPVVPEQPAAEEAGGE